MGYPRYPLCPLVRSVHRLITSSLPIIPFLLPRNQHRVARETPILYLYSNGLSALFQQTHSRRGYDRGSTRIMQQILLLSLRVLSFSRNRPCILSRIITPIYTVSRPRSVHRVDGVRLLPMYCAGSKLLCALLFPLEAEHICTAAPPLFIDFGSVVHAASTLSCAFDFTFNELLLLIKLCPFDCDGTPPATMPL